MKKTVSLLLSLVFLFSFGIIRTSAEDSNKISADLKKVIDNAAPTDIIRVSIYLDGYDKTQKQLSHEEYCRNMEKLHREILPEVFSEVSHLYYVNTSFQIFDYIVVEVASQDITKITENDAVTRIEKSVSYGKPWTPTTCTIHDDLQQILDTSDPEDMIPIMLWFGDKLLRLDDMPSWPDKEKAIDEYSRYNSTRDDYLIMNVLKGAEVDLSCIGGGFWILKAKAKDIPNFANNGYVKEIETYNDSIIEMPFVEISKIDSNLAEKIDQLNNTNASLTVYIELDIDALTLRDMPSYPDIDKAEGEYGTYSWNTLKPQFDEAIKELRSIAHFPKQYGYDVYRTVCYDALVVELTAQDIDKIANSNRVRAIKLYESDEGWQTEPYRYDDSNTVTRYRERFLSQYDTTDCNLYQELFHHEYTRDDKTYSTDWALVKASNICLVCDVCHWEVVGGRLLYAGGYKQQPFTFDVGLYDAEQDRFFDINEIDFDDYPDLYEVWQHIDLGFCTSIRFLGDADGDTEVTILDATKIQRSLVGLESKYDIVTTGADVDSDGEITVLDATRIQRYKADLCDLDGIPLKEKHA